MKTTKKVTRTENTQDDKDKHLTIEKSIHTNENDLTIKSDIMVQQSQLLRCFLSEIAEMKLRKDVRVAAGRLFCSYICANAAKRR